MKERNQPAINKYSKIRFVGLRDIGTLPHLQALSASERHAMRVVGNVLPFRVNNYIIEELIDWSQVPDDPLYQLYFPQSDMLSPTHFALMDKALSKGDATQIQHVVHEIRCDLNPHPAGQMTENIPLMDGKRVPGIQHKYRDVCLLFPANGQTCHSYCTYCFRWPQFTGDKSLHFSTESSGMHWEYLKQHQEVTDVLITGGDPMIMNVCQLERYIEPLLAPELHHIQTIRIGTKSVANWPSRYITAPDADDVLRLFEKIVDSGKHLAIMGHYSHWRELEPTLARQAIKRIRSTGAVIRTQAPIIRNVNDDAQVWQHMWQEQVRLGCTPYYMFIARDTGANTCFSVPLYRCLEIFQKAYTQSSELCRTVRGPIMSTSPGKVLIEGTAEYSGKNAFVLKFVRARNLEWCKEPFLQNMTVLLIGSMI